MRRDQTASSYGDDWGPKIDNNGDNRSFFKSVVRDRIALEDVAKCNGDASGRTAGYVNIVPNPFGVFMLKQGPRHIPCD